MISETRKEDTAFMRRILAHNLREVRAVRGLSQADLAELAGIGNNTVGDIEREQKSVGLDIITALALGLEIEVKQLLDSDWNPAAAFSEEPDVDLHVKSLITVQSVTEG